MESPGPRGLETGPDSETYLLDLHQQLRDSRARVAELEEMTDNIPEGCTPADARVLREANHALAAENDNLRSSLRSIREIAATMLDKYADVRHSRRLIIDIASETMNFNHPMQ